MLEFLVIVPAIALVHAQSCENYGSNNGTNTCGTCPPGFGGNQCNLLACGGSIFQGVSRPLAQVASGSKFSNATGCSCESGWSGFGCNGSLSLHCLFFYLCLGPNYSMYDYRRLSERIRFRFRHQYDLVTES